MVSEIALGVGIAAFLIGLCTGLELAFPHGDRVGFRSRLPGTLFALSVPVFSAFAAWPLQQAYLAFGLDPLVAIPLASWLSPMGWVGDVLFVLLLVIVGDFLGYWQHRFEHRFFWPVHAVHHSPTDLCAANTYGHFLQVVPAFLFITVPLSLIQFSGPAQPLFVVLLVLFQLYYTHSVIDFHYGPLRSLFVDNRFHRLHHSVEPRHFERNFGAVLTLWDRWFGTAYFPAEDEWPATGLAIGPPRTLTEYLLFPAKYVRETRSSAVIEPQAEPSLPSAPAAMIP